VTTSEILLLLLLGIAGLIAWKVARTLQARTSARLWLPLELRQAELAFAQKTFRTSQPIELSARADRAYRLKGELHLIEFKTRASARAYASDVIELSAQRLVIEANTGVQVSDIAYVLAQDPSDRRRSVKRVRLLPRANVIAVARRREAILTGRVVPKYASSPGLCGYCAYRAECKPQLHDHG